MYWWFISKSLGSQQETEFIPDGSNEGIIMNVLFYRAGGRSKGLNKRRKASEAPREKTVRSCYFLPGLKGQYRKPVLPNSPMSTEP